MSSRAISSAKNRRTTTIGTTPQNISSSATNEKQSNQTTANKELTVKEAFALMNSRISNLENQSKVNTPNDLTFMESYVKKESYDVLVDSLKKQFTDVNTKIKNFDNQPIQLEKMDTSQEFDLLKENYNTLNKKLDNFTKMFNMKFESLNTLNTTNTTNTTNVTNENSDLKNDLASLKEFTNTIFNLQNKLHENLVSLQSDIIKMNIHIHEKLSILESDNNDEQDSIIITDNINIVEDIDLPLDIEMNENIEKNLKNMMNAMIGQMENKVDEIRLMEEEGKLQELDEVEGLENNNELDEVEKIQELSKEELEDYVKSFEENDVQEVNEDSIEVIEPAVEPTVEPIVQSTVEPIVQSTVESTVEPAVEPIVQSTDESTDESTDDMPPPPPSE